MSANRWEVRDGTYGVIWNGVLITDPVPGDVLVLDETKHGLSNGLYEVTSRTICSNGSLTLHVRKL